ncbi:hypothetical protein L7F22_048965 [Adiantum nelumboides]|nr:hypothetical protein [Adiantum nelumboides]
MAKYVYVGIKQAPRAWYKRIASSFKKIGFSRSAFDANLYVLRENEMYVIIILYVDDLIITSDDKSCIYETRKSLSFEFEMTDLGLLHYCLGIEVWQTSNGIFISQQKYATEILKAFRMLECKLVSTPME